MISTKEGCAYKTLYQLLDWYEDNIPEYLLKLGCDKCLTLKDCDKSCKKTLQDLVEFHNNFCEEMDLS